jgi:hypothetical protein
MGGCAVAGEYHKTASLYREIGSSEYGWEWSVWCRIQAPTTTAHLSGRSVEPPSTVDRSFSRRLFTARRGAATDEVRAIRWRSPPRTFPDGPRHDDYSTGRGSRSAGIPSPPASSRSLP